jgi:peptidoglycan/LPS O-acetylase OafA/YrhL
MPGPGGHLPALDGVRGVAVLAVMLCHFMGTELPDTTWGRLTTHVFDAGWSGVDLFFVLSGFLITGILYDAKGAPHYFRNFYARRILRIFPLYYGVLIAAFWILPHLHPYTPAIERMAARQGWLWGYGANILMARVGHWVFDKDWLQLGHFWSLAIEEQFYLMWPLMVFLLSRRALMRVCVGCMATAFIIRTTLVLHHAPAITAGVLTVCRFDALAVGALAVLIVRDPPAGLYRFLRAATPVLGLAIGTLALARGRWSAEDPWVETIGFSLLAPFFAGVLLLALEPRDGNRLGRGFSHPVLRWFGGYSYAMYVFHVLLMPLFERAAPVAMLTARLHSAYLGVAVYIGFAIAATALTAFASWHLYEKHFLKLKRHFVLERAPRPPRTSADLVPEGTRPAALAGPR